MILMKRMNTSTLERQTNRLINSKSAKKLLRRRKVGWNRESIATIVWLPEDFGIVIEMTHVT